MRKSLLRKCFSLSSENIHKCEIIRTYIHVQLEKDVWGRRSCRRHCHTIVHWSCTLLSVRGNISLSFRHPQTDSPIEITTKEKYWCGCLIKQPHIYFTSGETEFKVAWKVSKPRWLNLLCNGDAGNLSFFTFLLYSYGQTDGGYLCYSYHCLIQGVFLTVPPIFQC